MSEKKMSNFRWIICALLFFATAVNYMDRQVLSLTWKDFIAPEFHWTDNDYGTITAVFSIIYAICNLFAGKFIDRLGTKKGYLWAIFIWSLGACLHAGCGVGTEWLGKVGFTAMMGITVSVWLFLACRAVLALGEAGNFPAAIKVTAEYFPKKDRAFATSIFNAGSSVGALAAPLTIPLIAKFFGWEMAFVLIGALGFIWMFFWFALYRKPNENPHVSAEELAYINQDGDDVSVVGRDVPDAPEEKKISFGKAFSLRQTWALVLGRFLTDGVWWFFLFWTPGYLSDQFGYSSSSGMGMALIFTLYAIVTFVSIYLCKLPTYMVDKKGMNPYEGRMVAMFVFACFPLLALGAQPLGAFSAWFPAILIGLACAGHQAWSANVYSVVGDMFPKSTIGTLTGIAQFAAGCGSFMINKCAGALFTTSAGSFGVDGKVFELSRDVIAKTYVPDGVVLPVGAKAQEIADTIAAAGLQVPDVISSTCKVGVSAADMVSAVQNAGASIVSQPWSILGFDGKPAGYLIVFSYCAVAYLVGWCCMKSLVPHYRKVEL